VIEEHLKGLALPEVPALEPTRRVRRRRENEVTFDARQRLHHVTGVDLTADTADTRDAAIRFIQPSTLLQRRLSSQQADSIGAPEGGLHGVLPAAPATAALPKRQVPQLSKRASDAVPVPRNNGGR